MKYRQKDTRGYNTHSNSEACHTLKHTDTQEIMQKAIPCINIHITFNNLVSCSSNKALLTLNTQTIHSTLTPPQKDIMTIHIEERGATKEMNICLSHNWLKQRGMSEHEHRILFHEEKSQHQWQATREQIQLTKDLMQLEGTANQGTLIDKLTREYKAFHLISILLNSFFNLTHAGLTDLPNVATNKTNETHTQFIQQVKKTISSNISNPLSLEQLAKSHNISISTLQRRFKASCDTTVNEYIRVSRLEFSKEAITTEGKSIGEAAYMAGYNHSSNFITAFKKQFNITPKELIQKYNNHLIHTL